MNVADRAIASPGPPLTLAAQPGRIAIHSAAALLALLVLAQLALMALVVPRGNFGLADDWTYAHSVLWLLDEHRLRISPWATASLLPQTLLGGLACAVLGFSFEVLRHVTQAVSLLAGAAAFAWFRTSGLRPRDAALASFAVIAMPAWPMLANSFMSDLYGLLPALVSALLFMRVLQRFHWRTLAGASLVGAIGVLEREVVLVVPFAFLVAWLWHARGGWRHALLPAVLPLAFAAAAWWAYHAGLSAGAGVPVTQQDVHRRLFALLAGALAGRAGDWSRIAHNVRDIGGYLGFFGVGWMAWWGMPGAARWQRHAVAGLAVALAIVMFAVNWLPPFRDSFTIDAAGIGPFTLYDAQPRGLAGLDRSPGVLWRLAGAGSALGIAGLVALVLATLAHLIRSGRRAEPERVFMAALIGVYLAPFVVTDYFDRYLLFVLPFMFALWARTWPGRAEASRGIVHAGAGVDAGPSPHGAVLPSMRDERSGRPATDSVVRMLALAWLVGMALMATLATHDYFAWNRARWQAIAAAEALGATPETLDGGYEYDGFTRLAHGMVNRTPGKSWWWVKDDLYVVAFTVAPGYRKVAAFAVHRWLPRTPAHVLLLHRAS